MARKNQQRNASPLYWSAETWAFMAFRLFLSLRFLTAGLGKFKSDDGSYSFANYYDGVVVWMTGTFAEKTHLPGFLVAPFAYTLAYVEIALGLLLLLGVKTKYVLALFGLVLVALAYGQMLLGGNQTVAHLAAHLLMAGAALFLVRHNRLELKR